MIFLEDNRVRMLFYVGNKAVKDFIGSDREVQNFEVDFKKSYDMWTSVS